MTKSKNTKKALLASVLSMLVCISMLVGSTFAWFTDSVTTGVNKIVAGNLDVKLEYRPQSVDADGNVTYGDWTEVTKETALFEENTLWEPGYTQVVYLRVSNNGSLALKYQLGTNVLQNKTGLNKDGGVIDLAKVLKFGLAEQEDLFTDRAAAVNAVKDNAIDFKTYSQAGELEAGAAPDYVAMVVYMPETVDNTANHNGTDIPSITFGISVVATQDTVEKDSFDNRYDANAQFPEVKYDGFEVVTPAAEFENALNAAEDGAVITVDGNIALTKWLTINKNITIKAGANGATFTGTPLHIGANADVTLEGLTFVDPTNGNADNASAVYASDYNGNLTVKDCTFKNCKWEGLQVTPNDDASVTVIGCTFTNEEGWKGQRFLHIESTLPGQSVAQPDCKADILVANNSFGKKETLKNSLIDIDFIDYENHLTAYGNTFADGTATDDDIYVCNLSIWDTLSDTYTFFTKAQ